MLHSTTLIHFGRERESERMSSPVLSLPPLATSTLTGSADDQQNLQQQYSLNSKAMVAAMLILCIVVFFVVSLHIYAKWFWRRGHMVLPLSNAPHAPWRRIRRSPPQFADDMLVSPICVGLDSTTINSLPTFIYRPSQHHDVKEPMLECAVCLSEFQPYEKGRILPDCKHSFHINCIDVWLRSHSTCPLCRAPVSPWTPPQHHAQSMWIQPEFTLHSFILSLPTSAPHEQTIPHCLWQTTPSTTAPNPCHREQSTGLRDPPSLPHHNPQSQVQEGQHQEGCAKSDELYDTHTEVHSSLRRINGASEWSSARSAPAEIQGQGELTAASIARCQSLSMPRCSSDDIDGHSLRPIKSRSFQLSIRWLLSRDLSRGKGRIFPDEGAEEQDYQVEQPQQSSSSRSLPL